LEDAINAIDVHLFDWIKYGRSCACGEKWNTGDNNNENTDPLQILHFVFDYGIRLGWLDKIKPEEAMLHPEVKVCREGRGMDGSGFTYLVNVKI
jgi:hypothetical protein